MRKIINFLLIILAITISITFYNINEDEKTCKIQTEREEKWKQDEPERQKRRIEKLERIKLGQFLYNELSRVLNPIYIEPNEQQVEIQIKELQNQHKQKLIQLGYDIQLVEFIINQYYKLYRNFIIYHTITKEKIEELLIEELNNITQESTSS